MNTELREATYWQAEHSSRRSIQLCGRVPIGNFVSIMSKQPGPKKGKPQPLEIVIGGLMHCGSPTACVSCSVKISLARNEVLQEIFVKALKEGKTISMITLTVKHKGYNKRTKQQGDALKTLLKAMQEAFKEVGRDVSSKDARDAGAHWLRVLEVTAGHNGWHPHFHVAVIHDKDFDIQGLGGDWFAVWSKYLVEAGLEAPTEEYGLHVLEGMGTKERASYLTKASGLGSLELTSESKKQGRNGNRSIWEVHGDAVRGDRHSAILWKEYEQAIKGVRTFSPARDFASRYGLSWRPVAEVLEDDDKEGPQLSLVGVISARTWVQILRLKLLREFHGIAVQGAGAIEGWLRFKRLGRFYSADYLKQEALWWDAIQWENGQGEKLAEFCKVYAPEVLAA